MMKAVKMLVGVAVVCLAAGCLTCGGRTELPSGFVHVTERVPDAILEIRYHSTYNFVGKRIDGYLAAKSGHSRGSMVDLTLVEAATGREADMGGAFDYFGRRSHSDFTEGLSSVQIANRRILREAMVAAGFKPLAEEWWHFTLKDEPYPDRYFDFPVRSLTALKTCTCGQFDIRLPECPAALSGLDLSRHRPRIQRSLWYNTNITKGRKTK